jgi:DNA-binding CsgD family transcriptional regulator
MDYPVQEISYTSNACPLTGQEPHSEQDKAHDHPLAQSEASNISPREAEVAALAALGLSNKEIAGQLFVSEGTVKTHLKRVFAKTGLRRRSQLSLWLNGSIKSAVPSSCIAFLIWMDHYWRYDSLWVDMLTIS